MHLWYNEKRRWLERFSWYVPSRITPWRKPSRYVDVYVPGTRDVVAEAVPREEVERMLRDGEAVRINGRFYFVLPEEEDTLAFEEEEAVPEGE